MYLHILGLDSEIKSMYENHAHFHQGDAGLDLYCVEDITIKAGESAKIDLKIQCEAFKTKTKKTNCSYYLYARSSISKTPLRMANTVGIIDAGYRGNIMMVVDNIKNKEYTVKKGDRLCQICGPTLGSIHMKLVDELNKTSRGSGGFGSTGK